MVMEGLRVWRVWIKGVILEGVRPARMRREGVVEWARLRAMMAPMLSVLGPVMRTFWVVRVMR